MRSRSYDLDRAHDLIQGLRATLKKAEERRLADLIVDLIQAAADSAFEYTALEEIGEDEAPARADARAQNGAAA